ncbi:MAG: winged helix DNA-binding domain-containing protein [Candidatus Eisenbacteria bacterium]|nr:winged helix DNA-binding domain-containing protein [Candidatus Eisenbacteria bacterium]
MAHADKSWTVPDEAERRKVWLRFADVAAVVLAGGRVVATWRHKGDQETAGHRRDAAQRLEEAARQTGRNGRSTHGTILRCAEAHVEVES